MSDSAEHEGDRDTTSSSILPTNVVAAPGDQSGTVDASEAAASNGDTNPVTGALAHIRERGFITTGELFAAFPNLEPDTDELRELYEAIESQGVKILDEIAEELQLEDQRR